MRAIKNKGAAYRDHRKHNKPTVINKEGRTCNTCSAFKVWHEFYPRDDSYTGHAGRCKECTRVVLLDNWRKRKEGNRAPEIDSNRANLFLMGRI